jgi:hypothetical protein
LGRKRSRASRSAVCEDLRKSPASPPSAGRSFS